MHRKIPYILSRLSTSPRDSSVKQWHLKLRRYLMAKKLCRNSLIWHVWLDFVGFRTRICYALILSKSQVKLSLSCKEMTRMELCGVAEHSRSTSGSVILSLVAVAQQVLRSHLMPIQLSKLSLRAKNKTTIWWVRWVPSANSVWASSIARRTLKPYWILRPKTRSETTWIGARWKIGLQCRDSMTWHQANVIVITQTSLWTQLLATQSH